MLICVSAATAQNFSSTSYKSEMALLGGASNSSSSSYQSELSLETWITGNITSSSYRSEIGFLHPQSLGNRSETQEVEEEDEGADEGGGGGTEGVLAFTERGRQIGAWTIVIVLSALIFILLFGLEREKKDKNRWKTATVVIAAKLRKIKKNVQAGSKERKAA